MTAAWIYTLVPMLLGLTAASISVWVRPGPLAISAIQHFAAGVVFAAAAGEILPDIKHQGSAVATLVGGATGVAVMLLVKQIEGYIKGPAGLLAAIGIDVLIDGLVLGIGFTAGVKSGLLLTAALSLEVAFLGLALTSKLGASGWNRRRIVAVTAGLMALMPIGALLATPVTSLSPPVVSGFLAFGLVALLYLVTEELLVEAHETPDRPWITAMFFVGFLLLLLFEESLA
ncbi:transporter [Defluviimonas sp. 20V17]|uniref:Membrane protein n=1 Tax=Allgaiera indica TaxID=765699 RepID=A0AAN5A0D5_9RHOB|nr:transporter [Allgaiera indica]KDB01705.1 transporter [Defluviimonas sp. 20V17]GHE03984.1 membrane protein [Allgaiera indica]SDX34597.1 zinc transporter, ZIP family [Allgaiera indica]